MLPFSTAQRASFLAGALSQKPSARMPATLSFSPNATRNHINWYTDTNDRNMGFTRAIELASNMGMSMSGVGSESSYHYRRFTMMAMCRFPDDLSGITSGNGSMVIWTPKSVDFVDPDTSQNRTSLYGSMGFAFYSDHITFNWGYDNYLTMDLAKSQVAGRWVQAIYSGGEIGCFANFSDYYNQSSSGYDNENRWALYDVETGELIATRDYYDGTGIYAPRIAPTDFPSTLAFRSYQSALDGSNYACDFTAQYNVNDSTNYVANGGYWTCFGTCFDPLDLPTDQQVLGQPDAYIGDCRAWVNTFAYDYYAHLISGTTYNIILKQHTDDRIVNNTYSGHALSADIANYYDGLSTWQSINLNPVAKPYYGI